MITEELKIKGITHIFYEMVQLKLCFNVLTDKFSRLSRLISKNDEAYFCEKATYTEALLIHVRTLKDFFECEPKNPDKRDPNDLNKRADMYAADYGFPRTSLNLNDQILARLDKDLAHLTYHRIILPMDWYSNDTIDKLEPSVIAFIQHIQTKYPDVFLTNSKYYADKWLDEEISIYIDIIRKHYLGNHHITNIITPIITTYIPNSGFANPGNKP
jgi:hypothetical protein